MSVEQLTKNKDAFIEAYSVYLNSSGTITRNSYLDTYDWIRSPLNLPDSYDQFERD